MKRPPWRANVLWQYEVGFAAHHHDLGGSLAHRLGHATAGVQHLSRPTLSRAVSPPSWGLSCRRLAPVATFGARATASEVFCRRQIPRLGALDAPAWTTVFSAKTTGPRSSCIPSPFNQSHAMGTSPRSSHLTAALHNMVSTRPSCHRMHATAGGDLMDWGLDL